MKSFLMAAAGVLLSAGTTSAVTIPIDDFSVDQGGLTDSSRNFIARTTGPIAIASGSNIFQRTLSINLLERRSPIQDEIIVAAGELDISNGTGERTEARVIYGDIANLNDDLPAIITDATFNFFLIESDANPVNLELVLNGISLGAIDIAPDTFNAVLSFNVDPSTVFAGTLEFIVNGSLGYDVAFDGLELVVNGEDEVPAPAMLGLFGLGLLALGARRRRA